MNNHKYALQEGDLPALIISISAFLGNVGVGACVGSLGPAIPPIAAMAGCSESSLGILFTMRGMGYFTGTALSTSGLNFAHLWISKEGMLFLTFLCTSLGALSIAVFVELKYLMIAAVLQGIGCGGMDIISNCIIAEVWGDRIQPWMQALHASWGVGALIGPALVGLLGYKASFVAMALLLLLATIVVIFKIVAVQNTNPSSTVSNSNEIELPKFELSATPISAAGSLDNTAEIDTVEENETKVKKDSKSVTDANKRVPNFIRILFTLFFFIYVGIETGFGGWVPTYSLKKQIVDNESHAAYLTAVFYGSLALGRIASVPISMYLSATTMIRCDLLLALVGSIFFIKFGANSYTMAYISCSLFGAGLSSLFPLMLVLPIDYGMIMDDTTTSTFIIGGTIGEALLQIFIGLSMSHIGVDMLAVDTLLIALGMLLIYASSHYLLTLECFKQHRVTIGYESLPVSDDATAHGV